MNVLGLETSCDETGAAVVRDGRDILSNVVATSLKEHRKFGGIIPEIASRRQLQFINRVVRAALKEAGVPLNAIDLIAVTESPGLIGSLLVGISFAQALSAALSKPLIKVDHIKAHLYANFLSPPPHSLLPALPAIGLVISGGHTSLYHLKDFRDFKLIGKTLDDAAGEAFDKTGRILGLDYPGGPAIDRLAKRGGNSEIRFTCAALPDTLDFSFSGIKTALFYHHRDHHREPNYSKAKVAFAFQDSLTSVLVKKCIKACEQFNTKTLLIGGGVAANSYLRLMLTAQCAKKALRLFFPPLNLCLDNAAMIAGLGFKLYTLQGGKRRKRRWED